MPEDDATVSVGLDGELEMLLVEILAADYMAPLLRNAEEADKRLDW